MPSCSSSSGMQSIRRELQRRRAKPLAHNSSGARKPSLSLPSREGSRCSSREPCPRPPRQEDPSPTTASKSPPASPGTRPPPLPRAQPSPSPDLISTSTTPPSRSAPSSARSDCRASTSAAAHLSPGTAVGVRTRTTKLKTGKVLVLWLRAMVVSPTQDGYEVVYDGDWPPGDPYGTVQVPLRHARMIKASQSTPPPSLPPSRTPSLCASATAAAVPASQKKKEMRPAPRPTRAGKSLRLVRSLFPELEHQARSALP